MEQKTITRDGVKLSYIVHKSKGKPWLLLIHGWGSNHSIWDPYVQYFKSRYQILTPDLRGHGLSEDAKRIDYASMTEDVLAMLKKEKAKQVNVIGHSVGAIVGVELQKHSQKTIKTITLLTPFAGRYMFCYPLINAAVKLVASFWNGPKKRAFMRYWKENGKPVEFSLPLDMHGTSKHTLLKSFDASRAYQIRWNQISCPVLVLQGAHDMLVSGRRLRLATRGHAHIQFRLIPGKHTITAHNTANIIEKLEVFWG